MNAAIQAQFAGFENKGLVGVGRLSGEQFDALGPDVDTLGGIFSGIAFDVNSWERTGDPSNGFTYHGRLICVPDRGYGPSTLGGTFDYHPRVHTLSVEVTPYYGSGPVAQTQIGLTLLGTQLLTVDGTTLLTGASANDTAEPAFPKSANSSVGQGRRSLDSEGIALARDGGYFLCDEYGPFVYRFDAAGVLVATLRPPDAWIPRTGDTYGSRTVDFAAVNSPSSGRKNNRGIEGLALSPDEKRLFALLQSPLVQDGGEDNASRNTRLLVFDVENGSPTRYQPVAEFIYELTLNGNISGTRQTITSELLALNEHQFLVLDRDQRGRNSGSTAEMIYKQVVLVETAGATNILGTGYDLEAGAPGQLSLPLSGVPPEITPLARQDFVDLLDLTQLGKFGLNIHADSPDTNTLVEKWEAMTIMPLNDPTAPDDYLLLVGCDNDFGATTVYHNSVVVGTNTETTDHMLLAWRVTLPGFAFNAIPRLWIAPEGANARVSWLFGFPHYDLQTTPALTTATWTNMPAPASTAVFPLSDGMRFFRLKERPIPVAAAAPRLLSPRNNAPAWPRSSISSPPRKMRENSRLPTRQKARPRPGKRE